MSLLRKLRKPRFVLGYLVAVVGFLVAHTTRGTLRAGLLLALLGESIRLWANGYVGHRKVNITDGQDGPRKIGHLITAGPYAFVRHPLYAGTFLIGAGLCLIVGRWWLALAAWAAFSIIYGRKMGEEEATLRHEWGEAYARYHTRVPQWRPTWRRYPQRDGRWSWRGILASKEPRTLIWVIAIVILFDLRLLLIQRHQAFFQKHRPERLALVGLLLALIAADLLLEAIRRSSKRATSKRA